jgi:hypothetical protein
MFVRSPKRYTSGARDASPVRRLNRNPGNWSPQATSFEGGERVAPGFIARAVFGLSVLQLTYAAVGMLVNPDFHTGAAATAKRLLGVDFNGWHALSGLLLFAPGLIAARRTDWSLAYAVGVIISLVGTALWTLADAAPAGLLAFPHPDADIALHLGVATTFAIAIAVHLTRREGSARR